MSRFCLGSLVSAGQQNHDRAALPLEIHPVAGTVVDPEFRNAFADGPRVSRVSGRQTLDPNQDTGLGPHVPQAVQPLGVDLRPANLKHAGNVAEWLHSINRPRRRPCRKLGGFAARQIRPSHARRPIPAARMERQRS